jgi:hypothetical protein
MGYNSWKLHKATLKVANARLKQEALGKPTGPVVFPVHEKPSPTSQEAIYQSLSSMLPRNLRSNGLEQNNIPQSEKLTADELLMLQTVGEINPKNSKEVEGVGASLTDPEFKKKFAPIAAALKSTNENEVKERLKDMPAEQFVELHSIWLKLADKTAKPEEVEQFASTFLYIGTGKRELEPEKPATKLDTSYRKLNR